MTTFYNRLIYISQKNGLSPVATAALLGSAAATTELTAANAAQLAANLRRHMQDIEKPMHEVLWQMGNVGDGELRYSKPLSTYRNWATGEAHDRPANAARMVAANAMNDDIQALRKMSGELATLSMVAWAMREIGGGVPDVDIILRLTATNGIYSMNDMNLDVLLDSENAIYDDIPEEDEDCSDAEPVVTLYGDWKQNDNGVWEPNEDGPCGYSAHTTGDNNLAVVWSKRFAIGRLASPCYPGSADARGEDSLVWDGDFEDAVIYYAMPKDVLVTE